MDINNNYKRFQTYTNSVNSVKQNTFKQDFVEQNYKKENKQLGKKCELETRKDLSKPDTSFLERSTRLDVNSQGRFMKK